MLRIGLMSHTLAEQRILRTLVQDCGHSVGSCLLVAELEHHPAFTLDDPGLVADAWVVAIETEEDAAGENPDDTINVEHWLDQQDNLGGGSAAIIFCDGVVPATHDKRYAAWARRLKEKLNQLKGVINLAQSGEGCARQVWVLAASTGGPAAVKQFLQELPPELGIGFVYVQHIDAGFNNTLAQAIGRGSHYPATLVQHGSVVRPNEVAIVSPDLATELLPNGTFVVHQRPWSAPYRPSADYIIANVAHSYGPRSGVIVFSGMGDDGAASSRLMRQKGGSVWVQSPASCTSDSMPQAVLATGCVQIEGEPVELAHQLLETLEHARASTSSQADGELAETN